MKLIYTAGLLFVLVCITSIITKIGIAPIADKRSTSVTNDAVVWFTTAKPFCNPMEMASRLQQTPPPETIEGRSYAAACYALAGKVGEAHVIIENLPKEQQAHAAEIVFKVFYPSLAKGEIVSSVEVMEMVLDFSPDHYMALYYAGTAEAYKNEATLSRKHLQRFLEVYKRKDQWTESAENFLRRLPEEQ